MHRPVARPRPQLLSCLQPQNCFLASWWTHQFVEMRGLLADNISLLRELEAIHGCSPLHTLGPARPRLREVTSVSMWCYCFLGYMAILTSDTTTSDQLAYARLMIREALLHGGPVGSITIGPSADKWPRMPLYAGIPYSQDFKWPPLSGKDLLRGHPSVHSARKCTTPEPNAPWHIFTHQ